MDELRANKILKAYRELAVKDPADAEKVLRATIRSTVNKDPGFDSSKFDDLYEQAVAQVDEGS